MIIIKNLTKIYQIASQSQKVLKNISLQFDDCGLVAIYGASGVGKTSLLNIIAGLDNQYDGEIIFNQENISKLSNQKLNIYRNTQVGYIFQNANLLNFLSAETNILIPARIANIHHKEINDLLKKVDLEKHKDKVISKLSGGQKQRVAIARALINDPKVILADEPTGALDNKNAKKVMEIFKELAKHRLIIIVSHNKPLIKQYCQRIITLDNGQVSSDQKLLPSTHHINSKITRKRKTILAKFKFLIIYAVTNLKIKKSRSLTSSLCAAIGFIGVIFSLVIGRGFTAYFQEQFSNYENFEGIYLNHHINEEVSSLNYMQTKELASANELDYGFIVNMNSLPTLSQVNFLNYDLQLKFELLGNVAIEKKCQLNNAELGMYINNDYQLFLSYVLGVDNSLEEINNKLRKGNYSLTFYYENSDYYIKKSFSLKQVTFNSKNRVYFYHNNNDFVYDVFKQYALSTSLSSNNFLLSSYLIVNDLASKNNLVRMYPNYDFYFSQKYFDNYEITSVYHGIYYHYQFNELINDSTLDKTNSYMVFLNGGLAMDSSFMNAKFNDFDNLRVIFKPLEKYLDINLTINEIYISSALNEIIKSKEVNYYNQHFDFFVNLQIVGVIESSELIIYQNSDWSYNFFVETGQLSAYEILLLGALYYSLDNQYHEVINNLESIFTEANIFCPLMQINQIVEEILQIIMGIIMVLSAISIFVSAILIGVTIFINIIEETKSIGILRILGLSRIDVTFIYIMQSLLLGLLAFMITFIFNTIIVSQVNLVFQSMLDSQETIITINLNDLANSFGILMSISFIFGAIPAFYATKINPLEAIKR